MITVWKREGKWTGVHESQYRTVVAVKTNGEAVNIEAYTIGPRGGFSPGYPGFSNDEWRAIVAAVAARRCVEHPDAAPFQSPTGLVCSTCEHRLAFKGGR